jgi:large subunit ribosomal protein L13e
MKTRYGRGFTLEELKNAGLNAKYARSIGIAVDHRRQDTSIETRELNAKRLKAYLAKLILFPSKTTRRLAKKPEKMTEGKVEVKKARKQIIAEATAEKINSAAAKKQSNEKIVFPAPEPILREKPQEILAEMKATKSYTRIRVEKVKQRYGGIRKKRAELAAKEAEEKAGKPEA